MAFAVPEKYAGFFEEVESRFRLLLSKQIVTGIQETDFEKWLTNFVTEEERYFAARLLENLTFRSEAMVASAISHILECILPSELRRCKVRVDSVDQFVESIRIGGSGHPVRFVEVEDPKGRQAGKSGAVLIRELHRLGSVNNNLLCFAKDIAGLPASVRCLVFVDDMLGTGTQFNDFASANDLQTHAATRRVIYIPLAAHANGMEKLASECAWLKVCPVEEFSEDHRFFKGLKDTPEIWAIDGTNKVADVRAYMASLCAKAGISPSGPYDLELLIGFHHATPNNTLKIMYAETATWQKLLKR